MNLVQSVRALYNYLKILKIARKIRDSELFDAEWYNRRYPDVYAAGINPLVHYIIYGAQELRDPSRYFETAWYVKKMPHAARLTNPLYHFLKNKHKKGKALVSPERTRINAAIEVVSGSKFFELQWYLATYTDVAYSSMDPLEHFVKFGSPELRSPGPEFDADWYWDQYQDARQINATVPLFRNRSESRL